VIKGLVLLSLLCSLGACSDPEFTDAQGNRFGWEDFEGRWLIINYWAQWCKPCAEEIPELNELYRQGKNQQISVLGINFDRPDLEELRRQADALEIAFPVLYEDPDQQLAYLRPDVLPTTYIFNQAGELVHKLVGPQTRASIEAHLTAAE